MHMKSACNVLQVHVDLASRSVLCSLFVLFIIHAGGIGSNYGEAVKNKVGPPEHDGALRY